MKFVQSIILTAAVAIAFTSCKKESFINPVTPPPAPSPVVIKNNTVFVYKNDSTEGKAFKDLMQANGCPVTLVNQSAVATYDLSVFKMIVVGNNTSQVWPDADANAIKNAGKPVLLIGSGGLQLSDKMGNTVSWGQSMGNLTTSFIVMDGSSNLFKSPKVISIPANNQLDIFTNQSMAEEFHATVTPVTDVNLIGKDVTYTTYYPVTYEKSKYGVFGFNDNVNAMTQTGKDFMVNLVYYVGNLSL